MQVQTSHASAPMGRMHDVRVLVHDHRELGLALRQRIQVCAGGQLIYFLWIPHRDTLRTFVPELPQEASSSFRQLRDTVSQIKYQSPGIGSIIAGQAG
jgi:hypothetical protein